EPGLVARAVERNQSVKTSVRQLVDFIGESTDGIEADADLLSAAVLSQLSTAYDAVVGSFRRTASGSSYAGPGFKYVQHAQ
ncbi:MAG: hypothetical protein ACPIOQ_33890, partial [Promethearchaeia archaeon]